MSVSTRLNNIKESLPASVRLVAVSKFQPVEKIEEAYEAGQRIFGENRVQELCHKQPVLPSDIEWHCIGHLQKNKVKYIAPFISMIESVDTPDLFNEIERQGAKCDRVIPCLAEIHVAAEESKSGFTEDEFMAFLGSSSWKQLSHIKLCGVMGMATNTDDENVVRHDFERLKKCFDKAKALYFSDEPAFKEISMGMSGDYQTAISCGSTLVRIGTAIFGSRQ